MTIRMRDALSEDKYKWNTFVDDNCGSFYHYYEWREIYSNLGYKTFYLMAESTDGEVKGIFPSVKIPMFLNDMIYSMPGGGAYCGPLSNDIETLKELLDSFEEICRTEKVVYSSIVLCSEYNEQLTNMLLNRGFKLRDIPPNSSYTFLIRTDSFERIWNKMFVAQTRNKIRKARKANIRVCKNGLNYLDSYYGILLETYKRLGSQPPSKKAFLRPFNIFKEKAKLFIALFQDKPIAGVYCFYTPKICYSIGNVSKTEFWNYAPNNLLYSEVIRDACENGYKYFDFGSTSPNSSHYEWKKQYGGIPVPIQYYDKTFFPLKKMIREKTILPRVLIRKLIWRHLISYKQNENINPTLQKIINWF